ncbi:MAG: SCO family protein [Magnetococcales bacterium]|nr:SCO family protein [Magnetococcales bacterium]
MSLFKKLPPEAKMVLLAILIGGLAFLGLRAGLKSFLNQKEIPKDLLGVVLPSPRDLPDFLLTDHLGKTFDKARFRGKWSFLFFGYTHCPDICPVTMGLMADVFKKLEKHPQVLKSIQGVFVSVDAKRDQPESLKNFVVYFYKDFIGVTGDDDNIKSLTDSLGVAYRLSAPETDGSYLISHSSGIYLVDPDGRFHALFQPQFHNADKIVSYFLEMMKSYGEQTQKDGRT